MISNTSERVVAGGEEAESAGSGPPPLFLLPVQIVLARLVRHIAVRRPSLFNRIGLHRSKQFLIVPTNLPYAMLLQPDPVRPTLRAVPKQWRDYDARITGTALTLLAMIDGRSDGDALFFSRDLRVEGDTEAVVCLRNALDDLDGSVADDAAALFGPPGRMILSGLRRIRRERSDT
ncbi:MAG: SCP2 sterol-binding domain-containing protein [Gammaproteobacteria bacterium]|nr:SCP2 sterol-binding domain-containing protein [Gammaproteobacteria bacterium]